MLRVVSCILHCHCHHCHSHCQKCRCRIHLLRCLRSNRDPILYHLATCILQQVLRIVVGAMLAVVVMVLVVFLRYLRDSAFIGDLRFAGFISSSGNCYLMNHKGTSSTSVFLVHPEVQGSICVSQRSVQCLYW